MKKPIVIMNLSHVYEQEQFYKYDFCQWLDLWDIKGTSYYLDQEAEVKIKKRMKHCYYHTIHFLDSGNYHYLSKYWLDNMKEPFVLVVFDHHSDMQPPLFENMMSCGCWVKKVLDENPYVKKVILAGVEGKFLNKIDLKYRDKIICYSQEDIRQKGKWMELARLYHNIPVYISVDKDVLCPNAAITNWDQGIWTLEELENLIQEILQQHQILGADICGESNISYSYFLDGEKNEMNDHTNYELLGLFKKYFH